MPKLKQPLDFPGGSGYDESEDAGRKKGTAALRARARKEGTKRGARNAAGPFFRNSKHGVRRQKMYYIGIDLGTSAVKLLLMA